MRSPEEILRLEVIPGTESGTGISGSDSGVPLGNGLRGFLLVSTVFGVENR